MLIGAELRLPCEPSLRYVLFYLLQSNNKIFLDEVFVIRGRCYYQPKLIILTNALIIPHITII